MVLSTLVSSRLSAPLLAADRLAGVLGRTLRLLRNEPERRMPDPAELSPHWLRDIGLPEDFGRRYEDRMNDWHRVQRRS